MEHDHSSLKRARPKTWERRINQAKKKHRSSLKNWAVSDFAGKRNHEFLRLLDNEPLKSQERNIHSVDDIIKFGEESVLSIHRIPCQILSLSNFINYYEEKKKPVLIQNIPKIENWSGNDKWSFHSLKRAYRDRYFKVGEDDDGYKVKTRMKYFMKYLKTNRDDSPLYVFDSNYDNDSVSKQLLNEYKVPSYFPDDLFSLVGERRRPPYRWFLVGPERSGTCVHIDPLGTSAWNTLVRGAKRWVLFPPGTPKHVVKGTEVTRKGEDDEATNYFVDILPRIKAKYARGFTHNTITTTTGTTTSASTIASSSSSTTSATSGGGGGGGEQLQVLEFIQREGDTVFVPGGWWHAVINLTHTIAVTQNFCSRANFPAVWRKTRLSRKKMSGRWLRQLRLHHPELAQQADDMNREDRFVMYTKGDMHWKKRHKRSSSNSSSSSDSSSSSSSSDSDSSNKSRSKKRSKKKGRRSSSSSDNNSNSNRDISRRQQTSMKA